MEIPTVNAGIIDTDKMSDLKALIAEKSQELHKLCAENNIRHLITIEYHTTHWHMVSNPTDPNGTEIFWRYLNYIIDNLSSHNYGLIFKLSTLPEQDSSEKWKNG